MARAVLKQPDTPADILKKISGNINARLKSNDVSANPKFKDIASKNDGNVQHVLKDFFRVSNMKSKNLTNSLNKANQETSKKLDTTNSLLQRSISVQEEIIKELQNFGTSLKQNGSTQSSTNFSLSRSIGNLGKQFKYATTAAGRKGLGGVFGKKWGGRLGFGLGVGAVGALGWAMSKHHSATMPSTVNGVGDRAIDNALPSTPGSGPKAQSGSIPKDAKDVKSSPGSWFSQYQGKYSWVDKADKPNSNASGLPDNTPGIALRDRSTLGQYFNVQAPNGVTLLLRQVDIGPHEKTGRDIDINAAAAEAFGYDPKNFPTDGVFRYQHAGAKAPDGKEAGDASALSDANKPKGNVNLSPGNGSSGSTGDSGLTAEQSQAQAARFGGRIQEDDDGKSSDATQLSQNGKSGSAGTGSASAVDLAEGMVGKTMAANSDEIKGFISNGGVGLNPATEAWCAAFVNSALAQSGVKGTDNQIANGFQNWGTQVEPSQAQKGDVVIQTRGHGPNETGGHVGIATGNVDGNKIEMIAGNSSKSVKKYYVPLDGVMVRRAGEGSSATPITGSAPTNGLSGAGGGSVAAAGGGNSLSSGSGGGLSPTSGGMPSFGGGGLGMVGSLLGMIPGPIGGMISSILGGGGGIGGGLGNMLGGLLSSVSNDISGGLIPKNPTLGRSINEKSTENEVERVSTTSSDDNDKPVPGVSDNSETSSNRVTKEEMAFFSDDDDWLKKLGFSGGYYPEQTKGLA